MRWTSLVIGLAAVAVLGGCGKGNFSERASAGKETVFRYPIPELTQLDPAMVQDGDTIDVLQQVFEGLVAWDESNKAVPNLAESWEISPDGKVYTFHIKKGVKFHNGREVNAEDFKYSIERATNPALKSQTAATYLPDIIGVKEKLDGKAKEVAGVKVIDDSTLEITIDEARPYFIDRLTYPVSFAVAKEVAPMDKQITTVDMMVGTGPFIAESYSPDQQIVLAANKDYRLGMPKISKIERPILKDAVTRLNKFKSGEVDLTRIERQDIAGILEDPKLKDKLKYFKRPSMYYMAMNVADKPFTDPRVRQAFAMAVDRDEICKGPLGGVNAPARSILPPGVPGYREDAPAYPYDPAKARDLLAQAGFPGGKGFPSLVMNHRDGQPDVKLVAEALVTQLRQNLGINVTTQQYPWTTYLDKHNRKELVLFHMRWSADYLDPENFLSILLASYGNENKVNYANPTYDALCRKGDSWVGDEAERIKLYQQAEDIALKDAPFVPIYFETQAELISPRVHGLRESAFGHLPHTTVYLDEQ
jgi:ABC-type transport system substrate-binding protein